MASLIDLFKGSPDDVVKTDTETFLEQETTGLRVQSAVDINNPVFYGTDTIRITTRTTPTLETMRGGTNGIEGDGGLVGDGLSILSGGKLTSLSDVRNSINDKLGVPVPLIPTRVSDELQSGKSINDVLNEKNGTDFGRLLDDGGGGNLQTVARNLLGDTISILKGKARKALLGTEGQQGLVTARNTPNFTGTELTETYTTIQTRPDLFDVRGETNPEDLRTDTKAKFNIDLAKHSPIYGVQRGSKLFESDYGQRVKEDTNPNGLSEYDPNQKYSTEKMNDSLDVRRGFTIRDENGNVQYNDVINSTSVNDEYDTTTMENYDLVPFWISSYGENKRTHFRTVITGLSENVSPSWSSNKFFGSPYSYHTYGGVERSVTFNLNIFCTSPKELAYNWEKMQKLTGYTYPDISVSNGLVNPPIIQFRIGDIYNNKEGFIESLSYTFPDNGTWETDLKGFLLPKFVDVSITIKLIENQGSENVLYNYERSQESINTINGDQNQFSPSNRLDGRERKVKIFNKRGIVPNKFPGIESSNPVDLSGTKQQLEREANGKLPIGGVKSSVDSISEDDIARVYKRPNSEALRELKFRAKGQKNTGLV